MLKILLLLLLCLLAITNASELYCVRYTALSKNNELDTCFSSKTTPIAAAAATSNIASQTTSTTSTDSGSQLTIDLNCSANSDICAGVKATLAKATDILSSVFQFKSAISINATYLDFCQAYNDCHNGDKLISIGQAYPTVSYIMVDNTDNMTRLYPQALLKQFTNLTAKPNWVQYDIEAQFNSAVNWYFESDNSTIQSDQTDLLRNCLHEIIHGLGFMVSWGDAFYSNLQPLFDNNTLSNFLTPYLLASKEQDNSLSNYNANQPFWGFVEIPLDKYVYYTKNASIASAQSMSDMTRELNNFQNSNALFRTLVDLANAWYNSNEYSLAADMYTKATTDADVLAMVNNDPILWLETSLNPFSSGSSLCHVSQKYINTSEYLMVYEANQGQSITQLDQLYPNGPLGESLLKLMAAIGYDINPSVASVTTIRPDLIYWNPSNNLAGSSSNPSPSLAIDSSGPAHIPSTSTIFTSATSSSDSSQLKSSSKAIIIQLFFTCIILRYL